MTPVRATPNDLLAMAALQRSLAAQRGVQGRGPLDAGESTNRSGGVPEESRSGTVRAPQPASLPQTEAVQDTAEVSDAARRLRAALTGEAPDRTADTQPADGRRGEARATGRKEQADSDGKPVGRRELTREEQEQVQKLQARDREVRAHEQAHKSAAGHLATSGPTYEYTTGPDGRRYATGGEVGISFGEGRTPEETLRNAEAARRAALAPAEPSPQDQKVAARAAQMASRARREIQSGEGDDGGEAASESQARGAAAGGSAPQGEPAAVFEPRRAQAIRAYQAAGQGLIGGQGGNAAESDAATTAAIRPGQTAAGVSGIAADAQVHRAGTPTAPRLDRLA